MRAVLDYCTGGIQRAVPAGTLVLHEGSKTGHLFVLLEGRLEVIKGDSVVAVLTEPGAMLGEMSVLLDQPHTATVRAAADSVVYEFDDAAAFLRDQPAVALLIARCWRNASTSPTPIWLTSCTNMPVRVTISRWSANSCRA